MNKDKNVQNIKLNIPHIYKMENAIDLSSGNINEITNHQMEVEIPVIG